MTSHTVESRISVHRVRDPNSEDLHHALDLYSRRIPEQERFELPDIVRWIREDYTGNGAAKAQDYFLVAKYEGQVCGFLLLHRYLAQRLVFIAYLASAKPSPCDDAEGSVSKVLLGEVGRLVHQEFHECQGLLLEVDPPWSATTSSEWLERLSRIRLFCVLAEAQGFSLRALDMHYLHPPLSLADCGSSLPMVLMHARLRGRPRTTLPRREVSRILRFIYTVLYPEGYSDSIAETRQYRAVLTRLCAERFQGIPARVPLLDYKQVKARFPKLEPAVESSPSALIAPADLRYDVFLSYRRIEPDRSFAIRLLRSLESDGLRVAIDELNFDPAESFITEMERCIRQSRFTLCLLSPRYLESGNTIEEAIIGKALSLSERRQRVIPIIFEAVERPIWLYDIVGIDFTRVDPLLDPLDRLKAYLKNAARS